jgi:hypothetical protein
MCSEGRAALVFTQQRQKCTIFELPKSSYLEDRLFQQNRPKADIWSRKNRSVRLFLVQTRCSVHPNSPSSDSVASTGAATSPRELAVRSHRSSPPPPSADIHGFGPGLKVLGIGSNYQEACGPFTAINVGLVLEQSAPHPLQTAGACSD